VLGNAGVACPSRFWQRVFFASSNPDGEPTMLELFLRLPAQYNLSVICPATSVKMMGRVSLCQSASGEGRKVCAAAVPPTVPLENLKMFERMGVILLGVHHGSTVSCSSSASTSVRAASANTWCATANRRLKPGAHFSRIMPSNGPHRLLHCAHYPLPRPLRVFGFGP